MLAAAKAGIQAGVKASGSAVKKAKQFVLDKITQIKLKRKRITKTPAEKEELKRRTGVYLNETIKDVKLAKKYIEDNRGNIDTLIESGYSIISDNDELRKNPEKAFQVAANVLESLGEFGVPGAAGAAMLMEG